jgi:hypothetical protein
MRENPQKTSDLGENGKRKDFQRREGERSAI